MTIMKSDMLKRNLLYVLGACCLLAACQEAPEYVLEEDRMTDLLTEMHLAEGLLSVQKKQVSDNPEYGQEVIAAVLERQQVSRAQYDSSLVWYSQHLNSLIRVYRHVDENLAERRSEWEQIVAQSGGMEQFESGDEVSLWNRPEYCLMDGCHGLDRREWVLHTDTTFHAGDSVCFGLHVSAIPAGQGVMASLSLLQTDENNVTRVLQGAVTPVLQQDTAVMLVCAADSGVWMDRVVATLHLQRTDSVGAPLLPCVVDSLTMIRRHRHAGAQRELSVPVSVSATDKVKE